MTGVPRHRMKEVQKVKKLEFWSIPEFWSFELFIEDSIK
jgi:hypothetical protein